MKVLVQSICPVCNGEGNPYRIEREELPKNASPSTVMVWSEGEYGEKGEYWPQQGYQYIAKRVCIHCAVNTDYEQ